MADDRISRWSVSGFGTFGGAWHEEDGTVFRRSSDQHRGVRANSLDFGIDSSLGLQLHGVLNPHWSVTAQAVLNQGPHGEWGPHLVWGFAKYVPNDWLEIRVGRLVTDIYLDGDSRNVGYAYTTVRPYPDTLGRMTYDGFDGMDATVQRLLGDGVLRFKLFGGRTRGNVYVSQEERPMESGRTLGATLDWIGPELSIKLSWGNLSSHKNDVYDDLRAALGLAARFGVADAAGRLAEITDDYRISYLGGGLAWERGPFSLQVLGADLAIKAYPDFEGWAMGLTAAYRMGRWKPFVSYSRGIADAKQRRLDLPPVPALEPLFGPLRAGWTALQNASGHDQYTLGAGVRYDFADDMALKFQVDRIEAKRSSSLLQDDGYAKGIVGGDASQGLTVFSATLDFVF